MRRRACDSLTPLAQPWASQRASFVVIQLFSETPWVADSRARGRRRSLIKRTFRRPLQERLPSGSGIGPPDPPEVFWDRFDDRPDLPQGLLLRPSMRGQQRELRDPPDEPLTLLRPRNRVARTPQPALRFYALPILVHPAVIGSMLCQPIGV